jgi:hypothetical protein
MNIPDEVNALNLVSTNDLIDELASRCEASLFIGTKPEYPKDMGFWYNIAGNEIINEGLYNILRRLIDKTYAEIVGLGDCEP